MQQINVDVREKIAKQQDKTVYICGNSDYVVHFSFDAEWAGNETKTARFEYDGQYQDVVFTGNDCPVPVISNVYSFNVGVYAGDLRTTTPAYIPCKKSILCGAGVPADPMPDVYNQLMEHLRQIEQNGVTDEQITAAIAEYMQNNPVQVNETDPTVPAWAKAETKPSYTAEEVGAQPKGDYALKNEIPAVPVQSVNGKTGEVKLNASDVGALPADKVIPEAYTLPVASADTLGGVKVGEGLQVEADGTVSVEPEGQIILYDRFCVGYELLTEKPDDWEENYAKYYTISEQGNIRQCSSASWVTDRRGMYAAWRYVGGDIPKEIVRTVDMYGNPYDFTSAVLFAHVVMDETTGIFDWNFLDNKNKEVAAGLLSIPSQVGLAAGYPYHMACRVDRLHGAYYCMGFSGTQGSLASAYGPANSYNIGHTAPANKNISGMRLFIYSEKDINEGSYFEVWGVRADA